MFQVKVTMEIVNERGEVVDSRGNVDLSSLRSIDPAKYKFEPLRSAATGNRKFNRVGEALEFFNDQFAIINSIDQIASRK